MVIEQIALLKSFYANPNNLKLPEDSCHRQFKARRSDGSMYVNKRRIKTVEDLSRFAGECFDLKNNIYPVKFYVTVNSFLNPTILHGRMCRRRKGLLPRNVRSGWLNLSQLIIKMRLFFDFDERGFGLNKTQEEFFVVESFMKEKHSEYVLKQLQFSGSHGLHAVYVADEKMPAHPLERITYFEDSRKKLVEELKSWLTIQKKELVTFDKAVFDPFRVYALEGSIDARSGLQVTGLTLEQLKNSSLSTLVKLFPSPLIPAPVERRTLPVSSSISLWGNDAQPLRAVVSRPSERREKNARCGIRASLISKRLAVANNVFGCKDLSVPLFFYLAENYRRKKLLRFQELYDLGSLYVFQRGEVVVVQGVSALPLVRLMKISKKVRSLYCSAFIKYKHLNLQVGLSKDLSGKDCGEKMQFIDYLPRLTRRPVSRPHLKLLKEILPVMGFRDEKLFTPLPSLVVGKDDYKFKLLTVSGAVAL